MAVSDVLLVDDGPDSCDSLADVIRLDYSGSGAYDGPATRELSRCYISGLALLDYRSLDTVGVDLDGRLKRVKRNATKPTMRAATHANIRQVVPMPVDLGRPIPPIGAMAKGP